MNVLAAYSDQHGACSVAMSTIARQLGVSRPTVHSALWALARAGYLTIDKHYRWDRGRGASIYVFNLDLAEELSYARTPSQSPHDDAHRGLPLSGVYVDREVSADGADRGCQPKGLTHKKPEEETNLEETTAGGRCAAKKTGQGRKSGTTASQQRGSSARQRSPLFPNAGGAEAPSAALISRLDSFDRGRQQDAGERLIRDWLRLDPDMALIEHLGAGADAVWQRALNIEGQNPGQGCKYVAGAIQRATSSRLTATGILAGRHAGAG